MLIGTNDIGLDLSPRISPATSKSFSAKIAADDPKLPIVLCLVMPASGKKRPTGRQNHDLNARLTKLAQGNDQVTIVDTYKLFANDQGDAKLEEFPDLLHPNDVGYEKWRAALVPVLTKLGVIEKASK